MQLRRLTCLGQSYHGYINVSNNGLLVHELFYNVLFDVFLFCFNSGDGGSKLLVGRDLFKFVGPGNAGGTAVTSNDVLWLALGVLRDICGLLEEFKPPLGSDGSAGRFCLRRSPTARSKFWNSVILGVLSSLLSVARRQSPCMRGRRAEIVCSTRC